MVFLNLTRFTAARRVPLIKFRKGGKVYTEGTAATSTTQASSSSTAAKTSNKNPSGAHTAAIEDWQLPPRYWRKPIDSAEMDYINRGGPA